MSQSDGMQKIQQDNDEIDLRDLIVAIWNGRWLIKGVTALVAAIALAYILGGMLGTIGLVVRNAINWDRPLA